MISWVVYWDYLTPGDGRYFLNSLIWSWVCWANSLEGYTQHISSLHHQPIYYTLIILTSKIRANGAFKLTSPFLAALPASAVFKPPALANPTNPPWTHLSQTKDYWWTIKQKPPFLLLSSWETTSTAIKMCAVGFKWSNMFEQTIHLAWLYQLTMAQHRAHCNKQ